MEIDEEINYLNIYSNYKIDYLFTVDNYRNVKSDIGSTTDISITNGYDDYFYKDTLDEFIHTLKRYGFLAPVRQFSSFYQYKIIRSSLLDLDLTKPYFTKEEEIFMTRFEILKGIVKEYRQLCDIR